MNRLRSLVPADPMTFLLAAMLTGMIATAALAQEDAGAPTPPLPRERPPSTEASSAPPLPRARPEQQAGEKAENPGDETEEDTASPAVPPPSPEEQTPAPHRQACPAMLSGLIEAQAGMPITEGACKVTTPLTLTGVRTVGGDVRLSGGPVLDCAMASETARWLGELDRYAEAVLGSGIVEMTTGPGYVCRRRNNAETGKVSEHGFGNALDISGFVLEDGTRISVLTDWTLSATATAADSEDAASALPPAPGSKQAFLRHAKRLACARFATVLSPTANTLHKDHLHLDLGCHGRTCTAQICE
jgi:hypothetical protein